MVPYLNFQESGELPSVGITGEEARAGGVDLDDILDAAAAEAGVIEAGLDGDDGAGPKNLGVGVDAGCFVDGEAETVPGAMEEAGRAGSGAGGGVAAGGESLGASGVDVSAIDLGAHAGEGGALGGGDGVDEIALGSGGAAAEEGARHVAVVAGADDAGEDINDDELVGAKRAGAAAVGVASLVAAGDDGIGRVAAGGEAGDLDGVAHALAGKRFAVEEEAAALDGGGAEEFFGGGEAGGGAAVAFANGAGFGYGLDFAGGEDGIGEEGDLEAAGEERRVQKGGKIGGHNEVRSFQFARELEDDLGDRGALLVAAAGGGGVGQGLEGEDLVEGGFLKGATEFEGVEHANFFGADLDGDEGVVDLEAGEVAEIGATLGIREKKERRGGHGKNVELGKGHDKPTAR